MPKAVYPDKTAAHHEHFASGNDVIVSSDRTFGVVFAVFFAVAGLLPLRHSQPVRAWALWLSLAFLVAALLRPQLLQPLNLIWAKLAILLHRVISPVAMALVYYTVFTVTGWLLRLFGKDLLRLRPELNSESYWILRDPPGPAPETMVRQF